MISRWPVRTGVLIENGVACFGAGIFPSENIYLYAVDATDGKVIWKRDDISERDAGRDDLSPQGYLLAENDLLFVPSGRSLPACLIKRPARCCTTHRRSAGDAGGEIGGTQALLSDGQIYLRSASVPGHAAVHRRRRLWLVQRRATGGHRRRCLSGNRQRHCATRSAGLRTGQQKASCLATSRQHAHQATTGGDGGRSPRKNRRSQSANQGDA